MKTDTHGSIASLGLLVLRFGVGAPLLLTHGLPKLLNFSERAARFANPIGVGPEASLALAVFAEVVCSGLVMLGFATRLAAIPPAILLVVAFFIAHAGDPFKEKELALVYAVSFIALVLTGAGRFSLDALIGRKRARGA